MRVAGIQTSIVWESPKDNFLQLEDPIREAADDGARLVVLPEMFSYGFSMKAAGLAEEPDGPSTEFLVNQASEQSLTICGSIPMITSESTRPQNVLVVASPEGVVARYAKIHPFTYADEDKFYEAGQDFCRLEIDGVRCTFFVCYDLRFADEFWATGIDTDLFVVVANWPASRSAHWSTLLRARAIENQTNIIGVNRVGVDGNGLEHSGDSALIDPLGEYLAEAEPDASHIFWGDVSGEQVAEIRHRFSFLADRR